MTLAQVKSMLKTATGTEATVEEIAHALTYTAVLREIGAQVDFLRRKDDRSARVTVPATPKPATAKPGPAKKEGAATTKA